MSDENLGSIQGAMEMTEEKWTLHIDRLFHKADLDNARDHLNMILTDPADAARGRRTALETVVAFEALARAVVGDVLRGQRGSPAFEAFSDEIMRHISVNVGAPVEYNTAPASDSLADAGADMSPVRR